MSGSEDGSIVLWDMNSKNILQRLDGHEGPTLWVDAHPFDDLLVSGGMDNKVKLWVNEDDEYEADALMKEEAANFDTPVVEADHHEMED